jgi:alanine-synthesizing transaminase
MFSRRLPWDVETNPLTRLLQKKRAAGANILDLTLSNPTRAGFVYPEQAILDALADARSLPYEPEAAGLLDARQAVSEYYSPRLGTGGPIPPSQILLTASTSEAYAYLFKLLADPGDEVLAPSPSYPLFEFLAALESVTVVPYRLEYDHGWFIDMPYLQSRVTPRTRAVIVVNPNNPTGSFLKRDELRQLMEICATHRLALISDEVFADYALRLDPGRVSCVAADSAVLAFSLSGLSKVAGLPQMKLGWIAAGGPGHEQALRRLELIADTYLSVSTPVQTAAARLLATRAAIQSQILTRTQSNLAALDGRALDVEGGWCATLRLARTRTEEEWVMYLLAECDVLVQPGYFFDFESEAFVVLSLLTPEPILREGLGRIMAL